MVKIQENYTNYVKHKNRKHEFYDTLDSGSFEYFWKQFESYRMRGGKLGWVNWFKNGNYKNLSKKKKEYSPYICFHLKDVENKYKEQMRFAQDTLEDIEIDKIRINCSIYNNNIMCYIQAFNKNKWKTFYSFNFTTCIPTRKYTDVCFDFMGLYSIIYDELYNSDRFGRYLIKNREFEKYTVDDYCEGLDLP